MTKQWALLCGGDYYYDGDARTGITSIPNLQGCVNDVNRIYKFLIKHGIPERNIKKLTASVSGSSTGPDEDPLCLPTWKNIKRELDNISRDADRGDLVYFHFSGHGTRRVQMASVEPNLVHLAHLAQHETGGDTLYGMALVTTDVLKGQPYITGYHLGVWVRKMVEQHGLRVTVVLDSCCSGGLFRGGPKGAHFQPRTFNSTDKSWLPGDVEANTVTIAQDPDNGVSPGTRDVNPMARSWLSDPKGCTVLTACGPRETAGEDIFDIPSFKQGLLTHWIIQKLDEYAKQQLPSHKHIVHHVSKAIRLSSPFQSQTPGILGDMQYEFFGSKTYFEKAATSVLSQWEQDGQVYVALDVGRIQGVSSGARYYLVQSISEFSPNKDPQWPRVKVTQVFELISIAVLENPSDSKKDTTGWLGVLCDWSFDPEISVAISSDSGIDRPALRQELSDMPGLNLVEAHDLDNAAYTIHIGTAMNRSPIFEIRVDGQRLPRIPVIMPSEAFAIKKLARVISHVARFRRLKQQLPIGNQRVTNGLNFEIKPSKVQDGQDVNATLLYLGPLTAGLWVSLYCFTASWGIMKLDPDSDSGLAASKITMGQKEEWPFKMAIPPSTHPDDPREIQDSFVVLLSNGEQSVISWDEICLPNLPAEGHMLENLWDIRQTDEKEKRNPQRINNKKGKEDAPSVGAILQVVSTGPRGEQTTMSSA
ncbi:hypothetical protein FOQG_17376 [Fusarium oxysporum f. sp. raphani 54005]|uniref:Peptidase C14 caspase domain-containing protein n=2 Tax=Fusarium oxysporum f. sp. raphani TaxID=96318 RepID=X0C593_FUSOX|nr:hypothetical protein FOQG_17376 [Fusarium oxysporum f. sp. raphani 54005]KAG7429488.1 Metacaspase-4 [Fusarium oxysporum f. sp. raphani]